MAAAGNAGASAKEIHMQFELSGRPDAATLATALRPLDPDAKLALDFDGKRLEVIPARAAARCWRPCARSATRPNCWSRTCTSAAAAPAAAAAAEVLSTRSCSRGMDACPDMLRAGQQEPATCPTIH